MHIYCFCIYLNSIVAIIMMLLCSSISRECHAHSVVKFLVVENVECIFYKYFWLELNMACIQSNLILPNLERTTNSFFKQHKTLSNLPFQRFMPISAFYPPFCFHFKFRFPPFSFRVLSPHWVAVIVCHITRDLLQTKDITVIQCVKKKTTI